MESIKVNVLNTIYTIVFVNTTLGRTVEQGLNVWVCEDVGTFRQCLSDLREKPHCRVLSSGPSVVKQKRSSA